MRNTLSENRKQIELFVIVIVAIFALFIRIHHIDFESLHMDEIRQISYYPNSLNKIIDDAAAQQQPPLDYWIGHFTSIISYSDFSVRLPSLLFGVGTVFILFIIISKLTHWGIALNASVLLTLSPYHIHFSQYAPDRIQ